MLRRPIHRQHASSNASGCVQWDLWFLWPAILFPVSGCRRAAISTTRHFVVSFLASKSKETNGLSAISKRAPVPEKTKVNLSNHLHEPADRAAGGSRATNQLFFQ